MKNLSKKITRTQLLNALPPVDVNIITDSGVTTYTVSTLLNYYLTALTKKEHIKQIQYYSHKS